MQTGNNVFEDALFLFGKLAMHFEFNACGVPYIYVVIFYIYYHNPTKPYKFYCLNLEAFQRPLKTKYTTFSCKIRAIKHLLHGSILSQLIIS